MSLPTLNENLNIHQSLPDQPALGAEELKKEFDTAPNLIKEYLNGTLLPQLDTLLVNLQNKDINLETALNTLSHLYNNLDSVFAQSMNLNFSQTLTEFHKTEQEIKQNELNREKQLRNRIIFVCFLIVIISVIFFIRYRQRNKSKLEKNISRKF